MDVNAGLQKGAASHYCSFTLLQLRCWRLPGRTEVALPEVRGADDSAAPYRLNLCSSSSEKSGVFLPAFKQMSEMSNIRSFFMTVLIKISLLLCRQVNDFM